MVAVGGRQNTPLLLGITHFNQKNFLNARSAFAQAAKDENTARSANQWLEYTERQLKQKEFEESAEAKG